MFRPRILVVALLASGLLAAFSHAGSAPKKSKLGKEYPFTVAPHEAFAEVAELEKASGKKFTLSPVEVELFADVAAGTLDKWSFAEMALIASGVTDRAERQQYLKQIDALEAEARRALADAKTERAKGDQLLRFLHDGAMAKGYESKQTSLATVLQAKRFNCVSSAVLYNVMGRRLGLQVRAVEIPATFMSGHVFSVLRTSGAVIDVETTNKLGFNPQGKRERPDGEGYDPKKDRDNRREVGDRELAAVVYYNRGVDLSKAKDYHAAVVMYFRTLALDATNVSAAKNILADLGNWGPKLAEAGKHEDGIHTLAVGLKLAPNDSALKNNYAVLWRKYAHAEMKAGREEQALTVARRAAAVVADRDIKLLPAQLFESRGEELLKAGQWDEALALGRRGLTKLEGAAAKELQSWRADLYLRWSDERRKKGDWDKAFAVLLQAQADNPKETRYSNNLLYAAQERLRDTAAKEPTKLAERVAELRKRLPSLKGLDDVIVNQVHQEIRKKTDQKQYEAALVVLKSRADVLGNPTEAQKLGAMVYDQWARSRKQDGWKSVMQIYAKGLKEYPGDRQLTQNAVAVADAQGVPLMNAKKWAEAIEVFEAALQHLPGNAHLEGRLKACRKLKP
jgi:tetratricopeptide (TPR) repeat protein